MANEVQVTFRIDQDQQGRTTLRQIDQGIDKIGRTAKQTGSGIDGSLSFFKSAVILEFFRRGVQEALSFGKAAVDAFNQAQGAALGLESAARFRGIDPAAAKEAVRNLDLVKSGLLSVGEASQALQAILRRTSDLDEAIKLLKAFGDNAAFNRQAALSFGQAVVGQAEGYKQLNNQLLDNGGLTTNASVLIETYGFKLADLDNKLTKTAATQAFNNAILEDSADKAGNAARLANTFAGEQAKLEAQQKKLLVTLGEIITNNPELKEGFQAVGVTLEYLTLQLKDSDSSLRQFVDNSISNFGNLIELVSKLARGLNTIAAIVNSIDIITPVLNPGGTGAPKLTAEEKIVKGQFDLLRENYLKEQKRLENELKNKPIVTPASRFADFKVTEQLRKEGAEFVKQLEEANKKYAESVRDAGDKIAGLKNVLRINPLAEFYDQAAIRQREFLEKFKDVPQEMVAAFKQANREALSLDIFKGVIGQSVNLANLRRQRAEISEGGALFQGFAVRQAREEELRVAENFRRLAKNDAQIQIANERILSATSDVGSLTPGQLDIRRRALDEQIAVQERLFNENFKQLEDQKNAVNGNTTALQTVNNGLVTLDSSLKQFANRESFVRVEVDPSLNATLGIGPRLPAND